MRRARWPAAARCPEGYHTKRHYGTTRTKSPQDCGLAAGAPFRQGNGGSQTPEVSPMKRKGHPNIPDFSTKRANPQATEGHIQKPKQPATPPVQGGKPHSTNKKSGRRGG